MNKPRETAEQSKAWDQAIAGSTDVLDALAADASQALAQVPDEADDTTW